MPDPPLIIGRHVRALGPRAQGRRRLNRRVPCAQSGVSLTRPAHPLREWTTCALAALSQAGRSWVVAGRARFTVAAEWPLAHIQGRPAGATASRWKMRPTTTPSSRTE